MNGGSSFRSKVEPVCAVGFGPYRQCPSGSSWENTPKAKSSGLIFWTSVQLTATRFCTQPRLKLICRLTARNSGRLNHKENIRKLTLQTASGSVILH